MPRVKRSVHARKKRRKVLGQAKGYWGLKSRSYRYAKEQVEHSLVYAYRDRKNKKRTFRQLWIVRINAAARANGLSYNQFISGLHKAGHRARPEGARRPRRRRPGRVHRDRRAGEGCAGSSRHRRPRHSPDHLGVEPDAEARPQAPRAETQARGARALRGRGRGSRRGRDRRRDRAGRAARRGRDRGAARCSPRSRRCRTRPGSSASTAPPTCRASRGRRRSRSGALSDPGNVGTLLRAADAFDAAVALSDGCADPLGPKALRASVGAIFRVPLLPFDETPRPRVALVAHGAPPLARARPLRAGHVRARRGAGGVAAEASLLTATTVASIVTPGAAESLNVAAAGAIALYERARASRCRRLVDGERPTRRRPRPAAAASAAAAGEAAAEAARAGGGRRQRRAEAGREVADAERGRARGEIAVRSDPVERAAPARAPRACAAARPGARAPRSRTRSRRRGSAPRSGASPAAPRRAAGSPSGSAGTPPSAPPPPARRATAAATGAG